MEVGDPGFPERQEPFDQFSGLQEGEGVCGQSAAPDRSVYSGSADGTAQETAQANSVVEEAKRLPVLKDRSYNFAP